MPDFRKKYFIIVLLLVIVAGLYLSGRLKTSRVKDIEGNVVRLADIQETITTGGVIEDTNAERQAEGLHDLTENELLNRIAEERARDLLDKQYFAHVSPTGEQATDIARKVGYPYKMIAENLAGGNFPTSKKMVDGWMQSPGHRKNILDPDVKEIGVAILKGKMHGQNTTIGVQIFGLESPPVSVKVCPQPSEMLKSEIETKKAEIAGLQERLSRLKEELDEEAQTIKTDRNTAGASRQDVHDLNIRIKAYNEKSHWHNRIAADARAKAMVLQRMIDEYNRAVRDYSDCRNSDGHE
ncbi:MAG: hypothetical protein JW943_15175 [Deltaproteobacteria bacterium]|nr:hypothetical protein [Deltaproteobacteria bacterium]